MGGICSRCFGRESASAENEIELSSFVHIDTDQCGPNVKTVGDVVSGTGCALASAALHQTKSYFEIRIKTSGKIMIGVTALASASLEMPLIAREQTWAMDCSTHPAGTILGLSLDLATVRPSLKFYADGKELPQRTRATVRGDVFPCIYVADGAVVQANFGTGALAHLPPGFEGLMCSIDII